MKTENEDKQIVFSPGFEADLHRRVTSYTRTSILWSMMLKGMLEVLALSAQVITRLTKNRQDIRND